ncbi:sterol desaturase/sphingolipid hydroxylase (fatty acid hydroxylase superfamily) [Pedobacter cryoconitis]|uniref:sterol desaturase family protein n=1 Tax=Pedobacter cryoconitis TaxID=188932 RepID=UPI00161F40FA|nr:sterol desaturase family protein [Pedobacter cryoconitis]MBB6269750.1 sterol desaturase/sphingolipid hydroxylase (fatty acid hydroxylase superfamily) [Pedobacter cryoconitis]
MPSDFNIINALNYLAQLPALLLWLIFLMENIMITILVLFFGKIIHQKYSEAPFVPYHYVAREWKICAWTNILNTLVTYAGFKLWEHGYVIIGIDISLIIITDFLLLFIAMDFLMFIFHYCIHQTFLYKIVHQLHHQAINPKPIDLFILHPLETISFGALWLILLTLFHFNIYSVIIYLIINVIFGLAGHLGIEPLPVKVRSLPLIKYLGTSSFHHNHHLKEEYNFGFYTSIWDRLFGTFKS